MELTIAERAEAVAAIRSGRMARLRIHPSALLPGAKTAGHAWTRLREGSAGTWSLDDLLPLSDAELAALKNPDIEAPRYCGLFYSTGVQILAGPGGIGKTWIALAAMREALDPIYNSPGQAVYLDLDNNPGLVERLAAMGVDDRLLKSRAIATIDVPGLAAERGASPTGMLTALVAGLAAAEAPPRVVIVDSLTRIIAAADGDSNNSDVATRALQQLEPLAKRCCVIVLDHTGHEAADRPRGASGKTDTVQNVVTLAGAAVTTDDFPGWIAGGKAVSTKDRHGGVTAKLADPADRSVRPDLGVVAVLKDPETGRVSVTIRSQAAVAGAKARRDTAEGRSFAAAARLEILKAVDAAARAAVPLAAAKASGGKAVPPLSARGAEEAAWETLKADPEAMKLGGRKSDVRAAVQSLLKTGSLVEYQASFGSVPGARLRVRGGVTDGVPDPVDVAAEAARVTEKLATAD